MMVLDLSGSMALDDMTINNQPASRLTIVKHAAEAFVKARVHDQIGLILFGSQAYLQTPLTYDHTNVLERIDDATVGLAGKTTSIGDALGLAVKRLSDFPIKSRVIILLTDGANNSGLINPMKATELAQAEQIRIYTIGLGSDDDPFADDQLAADLDEKTLKDIAQRTGGRYFRATDLDSLQSIYQKIDQLETSQHDEATIRPQKDYYPWCLAAAFCLFFTWLTLPLLPSKRRVAC